jgi:hypothetical protein
VTPIMFSMETMPPSGTNFVPFGSNIATSHELASALLIPSSTVVAAIEPAMALPILSFTPTINARPLFPSGVAILLFNSDVKQQEELRC